MLRRTGASILPCLLFSCWAECDLTPWLNEEGADKGYHVLCVTESVKIHVNGEVGSSKIDLPINSALLEQLETTLHLKGHLLFKKPEGSRWTAWPKQSWAVFVPETGERWEAEDLVERASKYKGVLLLFEGGTWRWPSIRRGYAREVLPGLVLKTVAVKPALFDLEFTSSSQGIPKLLTDVVKTSETNLFRSITEGKVSDTRTSDQAWLSYSSTQELRDLHNFTVQVLRIPESYFEEKLQVLRYKLGQYYDAHRDYWDPSEFPDKQRFLHPQSRTWNMRHATLLWYLQRPEEGGETWFPRAHGGPVPWDEWTACDDRGVKMGSSSVAILFYSLYSSGDVDSYSWHCGCPVLRGTKWAANSWVWNQPQQGPPFAQRRASLSNTPDRTVQSEL